MAGMMTERSSTKDPELAQQLLKQEQQNYIVQGETEEAEDYFESSRRDAAACFAEEGGEESGDIGGTRMEELCTVSWEEGEEAFPCQEGEDTVEHLASVEAGKEIHRQLKVQPSSHSGVTSSAMVQPSEETC